ncbi:hypothetical protein SDC9_39290 [bioreactor metagenome]|uniref:L,D-TPase catalytic domain-containing protein n=1 Tax=bioreactor metagenome TaxID=1076179 RepID=A0A644VP24_9ZZZZ
MKDQNTSDYAVLIYIPEKRLYLFKDDICIKNYPIASGKAGWPSPIGQWKIVQKGGWGEGFGGYWLGLNVTWGNYGIHGTLQEYSIGRAASHGCIRMLNEDVKELYKIIPIGTPVIINGGPYGPFGTGFRVLNPGDRGADVLAVQKRLKGLGYYKGKLSGIYEDDLKKALNNFQKDKQITVKHTITKKDYHTMGLFEFE